MKLKLQLIKEKTFETFFYTKIVNDCAFEMSTGKEFQRVTAAKEKDQVPYAWLWCSVSWTQNQDYQWNDEPAVDHMRCKRDHSIQCFMGYGAAKY